MTEFRQFDPRWQNFLSSLIWDDQIFCLTWPEMIKFCLTRDDWMFFHWFEPRWPTFRLAQPEMTQFFDWLDPRWHNFLTDSTRDDTIFWLTRSEMTQFFDWLDPRWQNVNKNSINYWTSSNFPINSPKKTINFISPNFPISIHIFIFHSSTFLISTRNNFP